MFDKKLLLWMNFPSHYQRCFIDALRSKGVDIMVCYYDKIGQDRINLGFENQKILPENERHVKKDIESLLSVDDWRERVHIVPGYREKFLRTLMKCLSREGVSWIHWGEPSRPGIRWYLSYPLKYWYGRMVNKFALGAFGTGELAIRDYRRWGIRKQKLAFLPYSTKIENMSKGNDSIVEEFCRKKKSYIFVGNICRRKAVHIIIEAFYKISKINDDWMLVMIGDGGKKIIMEKLVVRLGLQKRVLFRGSVEAKKIPSVLRYGDVLILPSLFDGWGVVLNEAASVGKALIASDKVGAAHHLIEDGRNGFIVRAGDKKSLYDTMVRYVLEEDLIKIHGDNSLEIIKKYSTEKVAEGFLGNINSWLHT